MQKIQRSLDRKWVKPQFINIRLGFEITMYINTKA